MFRRIVPAGLISALSLSLLLFNSAIVASSLKTWGNAKRSIVTSSNIIYVPDKYKTIQAAINAANPGDTIFVFSGTYPENVVVNKTVSLVGENRSTTIIDGGGTGDVVCITANGVNISGFTMQNGVCGIHLFGSSSNNVNANIIVNNVWGIGITSGSCNILRKNDMINNSYNFGVYGTLLLDFIQDIDTSNTVNGKPIYYWVNQRDRQVPNDAGYVGVVNSTNIIVRGLNLTENGQGVLFAYTNDSTIENVNASKNEAGIYMRHSGNNTISYSTVALSRFGIVLEEESNYNIIGRNVIKNNSYLDLEALICGMLFYGSSGNALTENTLMNNNGAIYLDDYSSNNLLYHNNFINNTNHHGQAYSHTPNTWNAGYPSSGNYWSDYSGTDFYSGTHQNETGGDGIGDTPYTICASNTDNYPLMNPWGFSFQLSHPETISIYQMRLELDAYIPRGLYLIFKFYSYGDSHQGNVTVWNGTGPHVELSTQLSHPLGLPIEIASLLLTYENGTIIQKITTFVVHRSHLMERLAKLDEDWVYASSEQRSTIFMEIVDIDAQWPYAPF